MKSINKILGQPIIRKVSIRSSQKKGNLLETMNVLDLVFLINENSNNFFLLFCLHVATKVCFETENHLVYKCNFLKITKQN